MKCTQTAIQLPEYSDGTLDGSAREEFETHLSQCEDCRVTVAAYRQSQRLLGCPRETLPAVDLTAQVMARVKAASSPASAPPWWKSGLVIRLAAAGAAAAIMVIALTVYRSPEPPPASLAASIALASPVVHAAFAGIQMSTVTVQNVIMSDGQAIVVLREGDAVMVLAGVNLTTKEVTQCSVVDHPIAGI
jgi:anti-sigma factor RsiW